jgi:protoporphyrinogen oxidase
VSRVVVIGAGAMGLAAAYHAVKAGHEITVIEAAPEPGGMAAHFDLGGLSIERFYHFVCKADQATFDLLSELGLSGRMRWVPTSMGYFVDGRLHKWGDPISLLAFPGLNLIQKLRYGAMMFLSSRRKHPGNLENVSARKWITDWCGDAVYRKLWAPLFEFKFYEYADNISAAWVWTRVKRVGTSRRSIFQEELGYIEGGSQTLVDALAGAIVERGGELRLKSAATRIECADGGVKAVHSGGAYFPADAVICTVPTPYVSRLLSDLPPEQREAYDRIVNIGVVCVVFRLRRQVTPHFWVNISDPRFAIPGIVEFSHLRPVNGTVVYVPYYMPPRNPKFARSDSEFIAESLRFLKLLNPQLTDDDVTSTHVGRLRHAQPVCPPGFAAMLPPIETGIRGLQIADTCFYYPEDRGISESVRIGKIMADRVP